MKKYLKEFREFAVKGNVVDLAVAVIIGGAFGKIVSSLVSDIVMPVIGLAIGGLDFSSWKIVMKPEVIDETGKIIRTASTMNIGLFIQNILDFLIIAASIFIAVKIISRIKRQVVKDKDAEKPAEEKLTHDQELLTEIRDLLRDSSRNGQN